MKKYAVMILDVVLSIHSHICAVTGVVQVNQIRDITQTPLSCKIKMSDSMVVFEISTFMLYPRLKTFPSDVCLLPWDCALLAVYSLRSYWNCEFPAPNVSFVHIACLLCDLEFMYVEIHISMVSTKCGYTCQPCTSIMTSYIGGGGRQTLPE